MRAGDLREPAPYAGALVVRDLDDGRVIVLYPMLFTQRLCIGPQAAPYYDDAWCFSDAARAWEQATSWDGVGEPAGWTRHPGSGRRRPDGDPDREYVQR